MASSSTATKKAAPPPQQASTPPVVWKAPTSDARPANGQIDEIVAHLDQVKATAATMPSDEYSGRLTPLIAAAHGAAITVRGFLWSVRDDFQSAWLARSSALDAATRAIVGAIPASMPNRGLTVAAETVRVRDTLADQLRGEVVDAVRERGASLATALVDAMRALSDGIDSTYADFVGPAALRAPMKLEDLQVIGGIEHEMRARTNPASKIAPLFEGYSSRGEDERAHLFVMACRPILNDLRALSEPDLRAKYALSPEPYRWESEREIAWQTLKRFDEWQRSQQPKSLEVANKCLHQLSAIFYELIGAHAKFLSTEEFSAQFLSAGSDELLKPFKFDVDAKWIDRRLPPAPFGVPGWTPGIRTTAGFLLREGGSR